VPHRPTSGAVDGSGLCQFVRDCRQAGKQQSLSSP
jgi:hypothetical protein